MKEKVLILAYMGSGKTETEKRYVNVRDIDFQDFKFVYDESIAHLPLEQRKGNVALRSENPDYPSNWILAILNELLIEDTVIVSPFIEHVLTAINSNDFKTRGADVRVILVAPERENFDEYIDRFKKRGNGNEFIERRSTEWPRLSDLFENSDHEKIVLKRGQFLDDALIKHGIRIQAK